MGKGFFKRIAAFLAVTALLFSGFTRNVFAAGDKLPVTFTVHGQERVIESVEMTTYQGTEYADIVGNTMLVFRGKGLTYKADNEPFGCEINDGIEGIERACAFFFDSDGEIFSCVFRVKAENLIKIYVGEIDDDDWLSVYSGESSAIIYKDQITDKTHKNGDKMGDVLYTDIKAYVNGDLVPSYNIGGVTYVVAADLRNYGFDVVYDGDKRTSTISLNPNTDCAKSQRNACKIRQSLL